MVKKKKRKCQPCTGCCDGWVQMVIHGVPVFPGSPCPHSTGKGCDNYSNRPADPCDNFKCSWVIKDSPLPEFMKPNIGKTIVLLNKFHWNDTPVDLAVPVGIHIPDKSLDWLKRYSKKHSRPLIYTEQLIKSGKLINQQQLYGHGPPDFQQDLHRRQQAGLKLW